MCIFLFFYWLSWPASISTAISGARGMRIHYQIIKNCCLLLLLYLGSLRWLISANTTNNSWNTAQYFWNTTQNYRNTIINAKLICIIQRTIPSLVNRWQVMRQTKSPRNIDVFLIKCLVCSEELEETYKFCSRCGAAIDKEEVPYVIIFSVASLTRLFYSFWKSTVQWKYTLYLDTRQPGSVLKHILHTRQSEIILEFPRKNSSNPSENWRSLFRNVKRFQ